MKFIRKTKRGVVFHTKLGGVFRQGMYPMRDWIIGLSTATIVFAVAVAIIVYDFHLQFVVPPTATNTSDTAIRYNERDVAFFADRFRAKDARFRELRADMMAVPDTQPVEPPADIQEEPLAEEGAAEYTTPALSP